jgi:Zn-finger protein
MYAIACKFPDQKRFQTMDIKTGEQVNNWMMCTLFKTEERANEILEAIKKIVKPEVEVKVVQYQNT